MDLVSSTLDKYLKHRFNGIGMNRFNSKETAPENGNTNSGPCMDDGAKNSETTKINSFDEDESENEKLPDIVHHLSIRRLRPSCIAISHDCKYMATGFDNSQIYLWKISYGITIKTKAAEEKCDDSLEKDDSQPSIGLTNLPNSPPIKLEEDSKLLAHYGPVYSIEFIKNNDLMLSCSEDTTIRLWCLNTKCNLAIYRGHSYPVWSIRIGPSREYFASGSMDATARLWRFDEVTPVRIFCGHDGDVECLDFHPNSKYIATGSSDTTVRLWSTSDAKMVRLMIGHKNPITSLSFHPDGKILASADSDCSIKIWNLLTNNIINELSIPASHTISFNPEQSFISSCGRDNSIVLWKVGKSKITEKRRLDLDDQSISMLITSQIIDEKLFVISYNEDCDEHQLNNNDMIS